MNDCVAWRSQMDSDGPGGGATGADLIGDFCRIFLPDAAPGAASSIYYRTAGNAFGIGEP
jgi:hypothetical protein